MLLDWEARSTVPASLRFHVSLAGWCSLPFQNILAEFSPTPPTSPPPHTCQDLPRPLCFFVLLSSFWPPLFDWDLVLKYFLRL